MKNYKPNSGQYVVYADHSTSGIGGFADQSTADPASLADVFFLPIMTNRQLPKIFRVVRPLQPTKPSQETLVQEYAAWDAASDEALLITENELRGITPNNFAFQAMLASEKILSNDWDNPAEDQAWADL